MRVWVTTVVAAALLLPVVSYAARPGVSLPTLGWSELVTAAVLVAGSAVTVEWGRILEGRTRVGQRPHKGLSAWAMTGVVLLPTWWVLPVVAGVYMYARWRGMRVPLWKWVTSGAILVLAALAAGEVPGIGPSDDPVGLLSGPSGVVAAAAAVLVFLAVESVLLFGCARLCDESDERWLRRTLADPWFYGTEASVLSLGMVAGLLAASAGWFVVFLVPAYALMQQAVLHRPLQDQASVDAKTGLLRYERWCRLAGDEVTRGAGRPWSVLFADLDQFKVFNDRLGHLAGDQALVVVARVLRETLRERDLIARFGGEEFCVLLPGVPGEVAVEIADRVRRRVGALGPVELRGRLTISIGVAGVAADQPDQSPIQALARADRALYLAKIGGRDTVRLDAGTTLDPGGVESGSFRHEARLYRGLEDFLAVAVPFVRDGLTRDEPVLVAVIGTRIQALRSALGDDAARVAFLDMADVGGNPARIIPVWQEFVAAHHSTGRPMRGIGEPIWAGRRPVEIVECQLHEGLLNMAVAPDTPLRLLCPYDIDALDDAVIGEAHRSHPVVIDADRRGPTERGDTEYGGIEYGGSGPAQVMFGRSLPEPAATVEEFTFDIDTCAAVTDRVTRLAVSAGLPPQRSRQLAAATGDIAATAARDADGHGVLRSWREERSLVCEIRDAGVITDPLIGRGPGTGDRERSLRRANQLCDLVQTRSSQAGTTVRLHSWLPDHAAHSRAAELNQAS